MQIISELSIISSCVNLCSNSWMHDLILLNIGFIGQDKSRRWSILEKTELMSHLFVSETNKQTNQSTIQNFGT